MAECAWTCERCTGVLNPILTKLGLNLRYLIVVDVYPEAKWISFCQKVNVVIPHRSKMMQDLGLLCFPFSDYVLQRIYVNKVLYDRGTHVLCEDKIGKNVPSPPA